MNAVEIIDEIIGIVQNPDYEDTELILWYANQAMRFFADNLLLPDLKAGTSREITVADGISIPLPTTYHKNLYLAYAGGVALDIFEDFTTYIRESSGASVITGDIIRVCAKDVLYYSQTPSLPTDIDLFFYRLPVAMEERMTSFPDGASGNDDFDWGIIHHACAKIFNKIEDGMEAEKINTRKHEEKTAEKLGLLAQYCAVKGVEYPYRPTVSRGWLGSS